MCHICSMAFPVRENNINRVDYKRKKLQGEILCYNTLRSLKIGDSASLFVKLRASQNKLWGLLFVALA